MDSRFRNEKEEGIDLPDKSRDITNCSSSPQASSILNNANHGDRQDWAAPASALNLLASLGVGLEAPDSFLALLDGSECALGGECSLAVLGRRRLVRDLHNPINNDIV